MREWYWVWVCQAKRVSLGAMNSAVCITLSRVGINTKFDRRWTENLKIAENCGREICMGAYISEGCQKSVSSPKTLETIKKVRGGIRSRDPCDKRPTPNQLSYVGSWQILGTNTEYRKPVITDRNWERWRFSRPSTDCRRMSQGYDMKCTSPKKRDSLPMPTRTWWQGKILTKFRRPVK